MSDFVRNGKLSRRTPLIQEEDRILEGVDAFRMVSLFTDALSVPGDFKENLEQALGTLGPMLQVHRLLVYEVNQKHTKNIPHWASSVHPMRRVPHWSLDMMSEEHQRSMEAGESVMGTLEHFGADVAKSWRDSGATSVVFVPFFYRGVCVGAFVAHDCLRAGRVWDLHTMMVLRTLGSVLAPPMSGSVHKGDGEGKGKKYLSILNSVQEVVFQTDEQGMWTYLNPSWTEVTGWDCEQSLGNMLLEYMHPDDHNKVIKHILPLLHKERSFCRFESRFRVKDGSFRWIDLFARHAYDDKGQMVGITGTFRDDSERKWAEEASRQREREESLERLAGGVAHDFNNILQGIWTSLELIAPNFHTQHPDREFFELLDGSVHRLMDLTSQLLAYARGGKRSSELIEPAKMLEDVFFACRKKFGKRIQLEFQDLSTGWIFRGDRAQLIEAVARVIENGVEAMEERPGVLRVSLEDASVHAGDEVALMLSLPPGDYVAIVVEDEGKGICVSARESVFEPFYSMKPGRRGLGLSAARGVFMGHGGTIHVGEGKQEGAVFSLYLPRVVLESVPDTYGGLSEVSQVMRGDGRVVLIAEDESELRALMRHTLRREGYRVLEACDGLETLDLYEKHGHEIDVCLIDYIMPGVHGLALLKSLREMNAHIPLVLCTGYVFSDIPNSLLASIPWLLKPFSVEQLLATTYDVLSS